MTPGVLIAAWYQYFFGISLFVVSVFMILLILVQRGRGGGLTGALGGAGGQSAFGAKAGDMFTRLTGVWALAWFLLCIFAIMSNAYYSKKVNVGPGTSGNPDRNPDIAPSTLDSLGGAPAKDDGKSDEDSSEKKDTGDPAVDTLPAEETPPELAPPSGGESKK